MRSALVAERARPAYEANPSMTHFLSQRTLQSSVKCEGIGLHSGQRVRMHLRPAPIDHGIVFVRTDLPRPLSIPALSQHVVDTSLATTLGKDGVRVGTVEHLLAALSGMGIDNVRVELDGPEVPIMDGSAAAFAECVVDAGIREQDAAKTFLVIRKGVGVSENGKEASLSPARSFRIDCEIDFSHPLIHEQAVAVEISDRGFAKELCRARTFGFLRDVERLKSAGLARGGSLDNAIVVDEYSILNPEGLRFPDEFVRHKALDAVGDLSLLGHPVIGHLKVMKSGHALNHKLVQKVLSDASCYELVRARRDGAFDLRLPELGAALEPLVA